MPVVLETLIKIYVYGKRLTSDTLFAIKNKKIDREMFYLYDLFKKTKNAVQKHFL